MGKIDLDELDGAAGSHRARVRTLRRVMTAPEVLEADLWVGEPAAHRSVTALLASLSADERAALGRWPTALFAQLTSAEQWSVLTALRASALAATAS